jgi:cadmium resistance protein CadD (predicted permease)
MHFGAVVGEACATFASTNIDDMFVLITFFAEASKSRTMTPLKIIVGQFLGFSVIVAISMIGFAVSLALPPEPIGFLGLLPILLGCWRFCSLFCPKTEDDDISTTDSLKSVLQVALVTIMNGGDNISTYVPLFSQAKGVQIAIYIIVYYILLGLWCLAAFLVMRQRHILAFAEKYVDYFLPFLYVGLGTFILVKSKCYPWAIEKIDNSTNATVGRGTMAGVTAFILLTAICAMLLHVIRRNKSPSMDVESIPEEPSESTMESIEAPGKSINTETMNAQGLRI